MCTILHESKVVAVYWTTALRSKRKSEQETSLESRIHKDIEFYANQKETKWMRLVQ